MLKDSKFSSHLLHLSQLQIINHKTLDEYRDRLKTYEVNSLLKIIFRKLILFFITIRIIFGLVNLINYQLLNVHVVVGHVDQMI
jgi:hypothetical protein